MVSAIAPPVMMMSALLLPMQGTASLPSASRARSLFMRSVSSSRVMYEESLSGLRIAHISARFTIVPEEPTNLSNPNAFRVLTAWYDEASTFLQMFL